MIIRLSLRKWIASGAVAAVVAVGAAWGTHAMGDARVKTTPVVFKTNRVPGITTEEAARAVTCAKDLSVAFRVASERVLPAVVTINTKAKPALSMVNQKGSRGPRRGGNPFSGTPFSGTPFEDLFRGFPMDDDDRSFEFRSPGPRQQEGMGSGVIVDASGLIMTNNHVVGGGSENVEVQVRLADGREFLAEEVLTDPKTDIAVIKIKDATDLVVAELADSDQVTTGDWVLALGQPFGLESTVTAGIVSATHRGVGINARESFLQTDAAINPGNSGGPLVNLDGRVVGINTAISSRGGGNDGVGFAIPSNMANWVGDQLIKNGRVKRAYLGVGIQFVDASLAKKFNVKPRQGVAITEVYPDSPAAKVGLKVNDLIQSYAGVKVDSPRELQLLVERSELGRPHALEVLRDGKSIILNLIPEEQLSDSTDQ